MSKTLSWPHRFATWRSNWNPPRFIEVPVPSQEDKRSVMLEVSILPLFLQFFY